MRIVLATGIYPPAIGGPATYVRRLAEALRAKGEEVTVVTYESGKREAGSGKHEDLWKVISVPLGLPILRWWRYARALKKHAKDADVVVAFSSISAGVPVVLARLKKPFKVLRLGGEFFWERYTDRGGMKTLKEWHASPRSFVSRAIMRKILRAFDHVVYSTAFQREIHRSFYALKNANVIGNALSATTHVHHDIRSPLRLLFMGRFVPFKNLPELIRAMTALPEATLTLIGDGPQKAKLHRRVNDFDLNRRVFFYPPAFGEDQIHAFADHDLLILPSITELSPNVALEAASMSLPVLLTEETGLEDVSPLITRAKMRTSEEIVEAVRRFVGHHAKPATAATKRDWDVVADEWIRLLSSRS